MQKILSFLHEPGDTFNLSIIWNEIIPNVRDAILVEGAMRWSWMLLGFSSLSFLGFGVSPPTPDWGLMISNARGLMSFAYWAVIAPIVGLSSFNNWNQFNCRCIC